MTEILLLWRKTTTISGEFKFALTFLWQGMVMRCIIYYANMLIICKLPCFNPSRTAYGAMVYSLVVLYPLNMSWCEELPSDLSMCNQAKFRPNSPPTACHPKYLFTPKTWFQLNNCLQCTCANSYSAFLIQYPHVYVRHWVESIAFIGWLWELGVGELA